LPGLVRRGIGWVILWWIVIWSSWPVGPGLRRRAVAFDLKAFFTVVAKDPVAVAAADVFEFLAAQRGDRTVVRLADRESGLSARTIARRLSSVSRCMRIWSRGVTRWCRLIRCRVVCRRAVRIADVADGAAGAAAADAAEDLAAS